MHFRLYFMNEANHITDAVDLESETEEEAVTVALGYADGRAMELWSGARRIRRFGRMCDEGR